MLGAYPASGFRSSVFALSDGPSRCPVLKRRADQAAKTRGETLYTSSTCSRGASAGSHGPARPPPGTVPVQRMSERSHPEHKLVLDRFIIFRPLRVIAKLRLAGRVVWTRRTANGKRAIRDGGGSGAAPHWLHRYMLGQPEPAPCLHPRRRCRRESCGTAARRRNTRCGRAPSGPCGTSTNQLPRVTHARTGPASPLA